MKSRLVDEKEVPPADMADIEDEESEMEKLPLVRKTSKKSNVGKSKVPKSEIPGEDNEEV